MPVTVVGSGVAAAGRSRSAAGCASTSSSGRQTFLPAGSTAISSAACDASRSISSRGSSSIRRGWTTSRHRPTCCRETGSEPNSVSLPFSKAEPPAFFRPSTTSTPLLYPGLGANPAEHENVIGYQEVKLRGGAERAFFRSPSVRHAVLQLAGELSVRIHRHEPAPEGERLVSGIHDGVRFSGRGPIEPRRGVFISNTVQVAGYLFGGDASDVREQPEIRTYFPISKSVVFATRAHRRVSLSEELREHARERHDVLHRSGIMLRDEQLLLFRAFLLGRPELESRLSVPGRRPARHPFLEVISHRALLPVRSPTLTAAGRNGIPASIAPAGSVLETACKERPGHRERGPELFSSTRRSDALGSLRRGPVSGVRTAPVSRVRGRERRGTRGRYPSASPFPHLSPGLGLRLRDTRWVPCGSTSVIEFRTRKRSAWKPSPRAKAIQPTILVSSGPVAIPVRPWERHSGSHGNAIPSSLGAHGPRAPKAWGSRSRSSRRVR